MGNDMTDPGKGPSPKKSGLLNTQSIINPDFSALQIQADRFITKCRVNFIHHSHNKSRIKEIADEAAIAKLRSLGDVVIPVLIRDLHDPEKEALAFNALRKILPDTPSRIREAALHKLGSLLINTSSHVRSSSAVLLGYFPEAAKAYFSVLLQMLQDRKEGSAAALVPLGTIGHAAHGALHLILNYAGDISVNTIAQKYGQEDLVDFALRVSVPAKTSYKAQS